MKLRGGWKPREVAQLREDGPCDVVLANVNDRKLFEVAELVRDGPCNSVPINLKPGQLC